MRKFIEDLKHHHEERVDALNEKFQSINIQENMKKKKEKLIEFMEELKQQGYTEHAERRDDIRALFDQVQLLEGVFDPKEASNFVQATINDTDKQPGQVHFPWFLVRGFPDLGAPLTKNHDTFYISVSSVFEKIS